MKRIINQLAQFALVIGLLITCHQFIKAQSALDGFDPNANNAVVAIAVQSDGKILIGGDFTTVQPNGAATATARNRIARLNVDGTLDTAFNPNAISGGSVNAIAVQPDGKILIGGNFTALQPNGAATTTARNRIARLNVDGTLDTTFDPNANGTVNAIAVQSDGKILIGGFFNILQPNGAATTTRNRIARLNADGTLDTAFNPNANNAVSVITVQPDGRILIGGFFTALQPNGAATTRNRIARLNADGTLDTTFDPNASASVRAISVQPDGKILIGGGFITLQPNGATTATARNRIARLNTDGTLDTTFDLNADNAVLSIAVQSDGKILIGGDFTTLQPNGAATTRNRIARLNANGTLDTAFDPNSNGTVIAIAVQSDGKILVGGFFTTLQPNGAATATARNYIARLERDGRLDRTLNLSTVGDFVIATAIQPDGKMLIGGLFTTVLGVARSNIARLNTDGTLDTTFNPNANNIVRSIAVQSDGKILAGGDFTAINGVTRNRLARLDATTGAADTFNPNVNGTVFSIAVQSDGKILVGGSFGNVGGQTRPAIARLDATSGAVDAFNPNSNGEVRAIALQLDGKILLGGAFDNIGGQSRRFIARLDATSGLADSFDPSADNTVPSIAVQSDGKILAGGQFTTIGGAARSRIARLDATSGLADSFNPNADNTVSSIIVQSDGKILVSGQFTNIGGAARSRIARLDATSGLADTFNPNPSGAVLSIAIQSDGKILAGGQFTTIGGQPRNYFARLTNDTPALSTLTVTRTTLTLTRDGSAPQFARVIFEQSTDNGATYTPLGTATNSRPAPAANDYGKIRFAAVAEDEPIAVILAPAAPTAAGYTLTGLNLPTNTNVLIRARGFYRTGFQGGSETLEDKVQTAFFAAPTAAGITISGRVRTPVGRGLRNAFVTLTDADGNSQRARTSAFGYYHFADVVAGQTYVIAVRSKRYEFATQVVTFNEDVSDLNFTGNP